MTGWLPEGAVEWQGRPVARRVADAVPRGRAVLMGVVRHVVAHDPRQVRGPAGPSGRGGSFDAVLDDGTGTIVARWVGRAAVPGVRLGVRLCVEGTVAQLHGGNVLLNPLYRFEAPDAAPAGSGESVPVASDEIARSDGALAADDSGPDDTGPDDTGPDDTGPDGTARPDAPAEAPPPVVTPGKLAQDGSSVS